MPVAMYLMHSVASSALWPLAFSQSISRAASTAVMLCSMPFLPPTRCICPCGLGWDVFRHVPQGLAGVGGPQVFSRLRSLLCVQLTPPVFLPGRWPCRFSRFNPWRLAFNRAARDGCIIARLNASVKRFSQTFSVCAICTVECVLRCADCAVECVTPELSRLGRFAGPGPCGLGLSRMLADGRAAVKTPKTFPPAPLKGGVGNYFAQI